MSPGTWPLPLRHPVQKAFILRVLLADAPTIPGWKLHMFPFLCSKCPGFILRFNYYATKVHLQIDAPSQTVRQPSCPCFPAAVPMFLPLLQWLKGHRRLGCSLRERLGQRLANRMRLNDLENKIPTSPGVSDLGVNPHLKWTYHRQSRLPFTPRTASITRWTLFPSNQSFSFSYF